jgi:alkylhydroperoxidase family enzyme
MSERIPRLDFHELSGELQTQLGPRVERLGYLGEFFKCTAHQPTVLAPFLIMTEALKRALPDRLTEIGALTVAALLENDYERHQHERLSAKLGFGEEWIAAALRLDPDVPGLLDQSERAVQRLAIAIINRGGKDVDDELEQVIDEIGPEQAVAVLFLIGRYVTHAYIVNALQLEPPVASIFGVAQ